MITTPCNPDASPQVRKVLEYLGELEGKGILTGQHTQTLAQPELARIEKITGKLPAICGFELLAYSPNIRRDTADAECLKEVDEAAGTLEKAWEWADRGGLLTFTWHWFSPLGGRSKSFYTENTDFDARKALVEGTDEHAAFCRDLDAIAELLLSFCRKNIPILWRPFHEAEGDWFWWGARGVQTARELYRFMYRYYTRKYHLNNLIWIWNSPVPEGYVGDDVCDIISRDIYPPAHRHGDFRQAYEKLREITEADKGAALAETGVIPDVDALVKSGTPWLWYMTWSNDFALTEEFNGYDKLYELYHHPYAVTRDKLPVLY